jgi:hypothetical protein
MNLCANGSGANLTGAELQMQQSIHKIREKTYFRVVRDTLVTLTLPCPLVTVALEA